MKVKSIIAIIFTCTLIVSTCVVSAVAYDHTYTAGYDYTAYGKVNSSTVFDMRFWHYSGNIYTKGINKAGVSTFMSLGASVYNSLSGNYITDRANNGVCANGSYRQVSCTDYRSTTPYVYYKHDCAIYGDTSGTNQSSVIAVKKQTVG